MAALLNISLGGEVRCFPLWKHMILVLSLATLSSQSAYSEPNAMDIRSLIDEYAKQENLDIVIDPRLRGQVSLSSELTPGRISRDEFYGALLTHNFGAVEIDGTMRIIQTAMMKQHKLPSFDGRNRGQLAPSQIVNSVMKLRDHSAEKLAEKLKALIPIWGYIAADTDSNSLIVVATVESVERMVELIDDLNGQLVRGSETAAVSRSRRFCLTVPERPLTHNGAVIRESFSKVLATRAVGHNET